MDSADYSHGSLAYGPAGHPRISYRSACNDLCLATDFGPATLHRGTVDSLGPDWKNNALPLTPSNYDETLPFPLDTAVPSAAQDSQQPATTLTLYRILWQSGIPARNTLLLTRTPLGTDLSY